MAEANTDVDVMPDYDEAETACGAAEVKDAVYVVESAPALTVALSEATNAPPRLPEVPRELWKLRECYRRPMALTLREPQRCPAMPSLDCYHLAVKQKAAG